MRDSPKATATYRSICGTTSSRLAADVAPPAPAADVASNAAPSANVPCNAAPSANVEPKAFCIVLCKVLFWGPLSITIYNTFFAKQVLSRLAATEPKKPPWKKPRFLGPKQGVYCKHFESPLSFECLFCGKWALGALEGEWRALGRGTWWGTLRAC